MKEKIKQLLKLPFNAIGFDLVKLGSNRVSNAVSYRMPTSIERLELLKKLGFTPQTIFDCGAHIGSWSKKVAQFYPKANYVLFEPNAEVAASIKKNLDPNKINYHVYEAAVGANHGQKATLNLWGENTTAASLLEHEQGNPSNQFSVDVVSLDAVAEALQLQPELIKLDLQGGEYKALQGAKKILETAELFIIEFGCIEAYKGRTSPKQLMDIMYANNYCLYDIVDMHYRPYDSALTGGDFFFVKNDSDLRKYKGYN